MVNARPCYNCLDMMRAVGIKRVYYSVDDNIVCENVSNMVSINSSSVLRFLERTMYNAPSTDKEYFIRLIKMKMPNELRLKNIMFFVNYNLFDVLPDFNYSLTKKHFNIFDESGMLVHKVNIIY